VIECPSLQLAEPIASS